MAKYTQLTRDQLQELHGQLKADYAAVQSKGLKLDMSRGKPGKEQLDLSLPMLDVLGSDSSMKTEDGTEVRNYGVLDGIPEAKKLLGDILGLSADQVFVGGSASITLMHDLVGFCYLHTAPGGQKPWGRQGEIKFLCPSPGYDRHFTITEHFGIQMIPVPMTPQGPDMDVVEELVSKDASIKGMWCVPKYSNPQGITYSDDTVRRLAAMSPAADDFRIFWDNAYAVHDLYEDTRDELLNIMDEMKKTGKENNVFLFCSTAKVTFPGAGISAIGASAENMAWIKKHMSAQVISYDKMNQLRHVRFLKDLDGVKAHMKKHMAIIAPKFDMVLDILDRELGGLDIASWLKPRGGYFIALDTLDGCAKRVIYLCKEAGVVMTSAGATYPYGQDPADRNIRIAPTLPSTEELAQAADLFCLCVKLASVEKLLG